MVKFLVMDDEPALRNIVYNIIKPLGFPIFTAEDGSQAVAIGKKENPDIALLDMRVPDMDGMEVLVELRKMNPTIKCIMLSGFNDVETAILTLKKGAFDYISKPFKIDEVLKVVNRALGKDVGGPSNPVFAEAARSVSQAPVPTPPPVSAPQPVSVPRPAPPIPVPVAAAPRVRPQADVRRSQGSGQGGKFPTMAVLGALAVALIGFAAYKFVFTKGAAEYSIPYSNPTGLCWIKGNLWICDWGSSSIYQHNPDSKLSIASICKTSNVQPTGLSYDGDKIWTCNSAEKKIYRHSMNGSLTVETVFAPAGISPSGLYFDGANMWVLDNSSAKIYKHKTDDVFSMVSEYDSPAMNPCGMFKLDDKFYIGDYKTGNIYTVSAKDFTISGVYSIPLFEKNDYKLAGLCSDGNNIWVASDGNGKIFKIPFSSLKSIKF